MMLESLDPQIKILETPADMESVETLQRVVWPGSETTVVPGHLLLTAAHNGGLVLGALFDGQLIGFVFGFPGLYTTPQGLRIKHCSHMLGVHPDYRETGIGFALKRAQWQMVRHQGVERITWTYDPLLSVNAHLNIAKLGAVSNTYLREAYGEMRDGLNAGVPSDRLEVDLWVNSPRVENRMSRRPRRRLDLAHYLQAGAEVLNPTRIDPNGLPQPSNSDDLPVLPAGNASDPSVVLVEIPAEYLTIKRQDRELAIAWRIHIRRLLEHLFAGGYLITDFVFLSGTHPRSFYVLSHGDRTLGE